jgi:large subunit ribosomal protein L15
MNLDEILSAAGKYKNRKRRGRGDGSGNGCTAGRGHKGAHSRAGFSRRFNYEGGQNPMISRIPKRGFNNVNFRTDYQLVGLEDLQAFEDGETIDAASLCEAGLIDSPQRPVKILANGELNKKLTVVADRFSASAVEKIAAAGGTARRVDGAEPAAAEPAAQTPAEAPGESQEAQDQ